MPMSMFICHNNVVLGLVVYECAWECSVREFDSHSGQFIAPNIRHIADMVMENVHNFDLQYN